VMETSAVEFRCKCSYDRAVSIVTMLGNEEVAEMLTEDKGADLTCHFCGTTYHLDQAALETILNPLPELVM
ncbi:MAG: Hsp33 family molecular chaperone HslO, partial [Blastocatellia bacterium]